MSATATATLSGRVKWFNADKGYGFIVPDDGSRELFVHFNEIVAPGYKALNKDDQVIFNELADVKGRKATNVIVTVPNGPRATRTSKHEDR